jgi:tetratricopeptide (TPR) repeat protein
MAAERHRLNVSRRQFVRGVRVFGVGLLACALAAGVVFPGDILAQSTAEELRESSLARSRQGDFRGASDDLDRAIELAPGDARLYSDRARLLIIFQDFGGALEDAERAVQLGPSSGASYFSRSLTRDFLGDYVGALEDASRAVQLEPSALHYSRRGNARMSLEDYRGALEDYNHAVRMEPGWGNYFSRGTARNALGDYRGAVDDFTQVLRLAPNLAPAYEQRAATRVQMRDFEGARNDWQRAADLHLEQGDTASYFRVLDTMRTAPRSR